MKNHNHIFINSIIILMVLWNIFMSGLVVYQNSVIRANAQVTLELVRVATILAQEINNIKSLLKIDTQGKL